MLFSKHANWLNKCENTFKHTKQLCGSRYRKELIMFSTKGFHVYIQTFLILFNYINVPETEIFVCAIVVHTEIFNISLPLGL